jgi:two-component sensor histidine kinase
MFGCFGLFIFTCGGTHAMEIWTLWQPVYWFSGTVKAACALSSVATACLLVRLVPEALALPSPTELKRALDEKEVLLNEVHHRVKNNLQVMASLLNLQLGHIAGSAEEMLKESRGRVQSIALVHEKLYRLKAGLARIPIRDYLTDLAAELVKSYGKEASVETSVVADENLAMPVDTIVPAGLITTELVTNALRHAFPDSRGGTIRVGVEAIDEHRFRLSVRDNGVGLPAGFDWKASSTLGFKLVRLLVEQLDGEAETKPADGGGLEFAATLRVRPWT